MYSQKVTIKNQSGLHARPAMLFVQTASKFTSDITFCKTSKPEAVKKAKSVIAVMSAGAKLNEEIEIFANGADEVEAVNALVELINSNCGE